MMSSPSTRAAARARFAVGTFPAASVVGGERIDDLRYLDDPGDRNAAQLRVFADRVLARREIDAERAIGGHVAVLPLDVLAELLDRAVGGASRSAKLDDRHAPDARDHPLDQVSLEMRHALLPCRPGRAFWSGACGRKR